MDDFDFIYVPFLTHQSFGEKYIDILTVEFDKIIPKCFGMVDNEVLFFKYSENDFEFRCHKKLKLPQTIYGKFQLDVQEFFLMIFGSRYGIKIMNFGISESKIEKACKLLIVNHVHGS